MFSHMLVLTLKKLACYSEKKKSKFIADIICRFFNPKKLYQK